MDDYLHGSGNSPQLKQINDIIHPTLPVTDDNKKRELRHRNRMTGEEVWQKIIHFDVYFNCSRSNCALCFNSEINPQPNQAYDLTSLDQRLRQVTLDYLKEMKTSIDILSNLNLSTLIFSDLGDYQERSASLSLEERLRELEGLNENLGSLLDSSPSSSSDNNNANSENS